MLWESWRLSGVELLGLVLLVALVAAAWFAGRRARALWALGIGLVALTGPIAVYAPVQFSATAAQYLLLAGVVGPLLGGAIYSRSTAQQPEAGQKVATPVTAVAQWAVILTLVLLAGSLFSLLLPAAKSEPWLNLVICAVLLGGGVAVGGAVVRQKHERGPAGLLAGAGLLGIGLWLAVNDLLLAAGHFGLTGRTWGPDALGDQRLSSVMFIVFGLAVSGLAVAQLLSGVSARTRSSSPPHLDHQVDEKLKEFFGPRGTGAR